MQLFSVVSLITLLAITSAFKFDEKIELKSKEKPFIGLRRGAISDVIPKSRNNTHGGRIVNGQNASEQQLPYQAGLLIGFKNGDYAWCGGTIIGNDWILTAAHCTSGAKTIEVRLGSVYNDRPLLTVWGYENHIHGGWSKNGHDIALVKVQRINYNSNIGRAALPSRNGKQSQYVDSKAVASGWGSIDDDGHSSNRLKYVSMTVISRDACARVYGSELKPSILCTNTKGVGSTCSGDSGGPLIVENTRLLIGIVAFGSASGCALGFPAGFTRVTYFLDWIHQVSGISW